MLNAQMPEPVPEFDPRPVEEPPLPVPPVEEPLPGEPVPGVPVPDRLSPLARGVLLGMGCAAALVIGMPAVLAQQSGPQTAAPAPLPRSIRPDTPGGSTKNGIATPPATVDRSINQGVPATAGSGQSVIAPPGTPGGNQNVVPK